MKKIYIYVNQSNPFYSVYKQTQLLKERLEQIYHTSISYITTEQLSTYMHRNDAIILWPYDAFNGLLMRYWHLNNVVFIYHNITPAHFFWFTEPLVGIKALLGRVQLWRLRLLPTRWLAASQYNQNDLLRYSNHPVEICSNQLQICQCDTPKSEQPLLVYVGRIVQNKRCLSLLRTIVDVASRLPQPLQLHIVGSGKKHSLYWKLFLRRIAKCYPNLQITHTLSMNKDELDKLYQQAWVYLSLSRHEGFGLPVCEAIENGTPALYTRCGGQESLLHNEGLTSDKEFSHVLQDLLQDTTKRQQLLERQQQYVQPMVIPAQDDHIKHVFNSFLQ